MNLFSKTKVGRGIALCLWTAIYYATFHYIESQHQRVEILHTKLDDLIPFCKYFIIPYMLWFFYVAGTLIYFCAVNYKEEVYRKLIYSMGLGIVIFIVFSVGFPNGQNMRPYLSGKDLFEQMVLFIYRTDTPTNIFPSLHVYCSVACLNAILNRENRPEKDMVGIGCTILTVAIILSTMFLKQHSVIDVSAGLLLGGGAYMLFYKKRESKYALPDFTQIR